MEFSSSERFEIREQVNSLISITDEIGRFSPKSAGLDGRNLGSNEGFDCRWENCRHALATIVSPGVV